MNVARRWSWSEGWGWTLIGAAVKLGDVIEVDDRNYRFGIGPLILRVTMLGDPKRATDSEWLDLEGLELRRDGTQISQQPRPVSVRVRGVRLQAGPYAWS